MKPNHLHGTDQPEWSEAEKKVAIESYHQYPDHTIAIYVGNEDLVPFGTYTVDDLIGHMDGKKRWKLLSECRWVDCLGPLRPEIDSCVQNRPPQGRRQGARGDGAAHDGVGDGRPQHGPPRGSLRRDWYVVVKWEFWCRCPPPV